MPAISLKDLLEKAKDKERKGDKRSAASQYALLGSILIKKENWEKAEVLLLKAASLQPDSPRLYVLLAKLAASTKSQAKMEKATADFAKSLLAKGGEWEKYRDFLERELRELPKAREFCYRAVLELDRTSAIPFMGLAEAQTQLGDHTNAKQTLLDALRTKTMDREVAERLDEVLKKVDDKKGRIHLESFLAGRLTLDDLTSLIGKSRALAQLI